MKKIALILAAIFLIGALTGTITTFAKGKGSATPKDESGSIIAGGGSSSGGSSWKPSDSGTAVVIPTSKPTFKNETKNMSLKHTADFTTPYANGGTGVERGFVLYCDDGFTYTQGSAGLYVKNLSYMHLGSDGVDTKCDFTFRQYRDYTRKEQRFAASFSVKGSEDGTLKSEVHVRLDNDTATADVAQVVVFEDEKIYAVDRTQGKILIGDMRQTARQISYVVDMTTQIFRLWLDDVYCGEFTLASKQTTDMTSCQYFGYYIAPYEPNVGKSMTINDIKIYY